ncbi:ABC transporter ATP-binding protein [Estrella lausannensis]|uniref:ABC transporter related-protein n=1 Tax=Estrella lausannensis TaxID=483423 RepID=A0A0H5DQ49_9BACT|nr:ABC transporter ATP-binding protein [Estrella lausannensis]CRX38612.1 ABC transporter related-protein [Estrella lausannensis]
MADLPRTRAVHVRKVSKDFCQGNDCVHALKAVDFDAYFGELLMIVGPSGCGKTTLLSVIAGTLRFDSGEIDVMEKPLEKMSDNEITLFRRQYIGFIFQQFHLIKTLTNEENVAIPLILNGYPQKDAREKAREMLARVGLEGREKESPRNLSGGQQQRVAIARALVHDPKVVICDEPTSALDAENGHKIMELLVSVAKDSERTVILVTHDSRIFKYADRLAKMDDGSVTEVISNHIKTGTPQ